MEARTIGTRLAALAAMVVGCTGDPRAVDPGGDPGTDTGTGTDTASDTGTDTGTGDCESYPPGPWAWNLGGIVSDAAFPAMYGPEGEATELRMEDVHCGEARALVFALGAGD